MAIPKKPLELNVNAKDLTLDEMALLERKGFNWYDFRQFLIDHAANWSAEEVGKITIGELDVIGEQIKEAAEKVAVPLASSPPSKNGRALKATRSRPGRSNSSTPKNSELIPKASEQP